jgi:hypothetical protein
MTSAKYYLHQVQFQGFVNVIVFDCQVFESVESLLRDSPLAPPLETHEADETHFEFH